jgi:Heparinase II/III-like protein/Heparinase II/III N-terminus
MGMQLLNIMSGNNQSGRSERLESARAAALRAEIARGPFSPFDQLDTTAKHFSSGFRGMVDDILSKGFERDGIVLPSIKPPIPFDKFNRSFCFHIHAWEPLTFLLQAHSQFGGAEYLHASFEFAWDWFTRYQASLLAMPRAGALAYAASHTDTQAWYDMGVGQRAYRLAYLVDAVARLPEKYADDVFAQLYETLQFHHELLSIDSFFVGHTNHGLYQALGQLAAAHRFRHLDGQEKYYQIASRRLKVMIERSFFPSAMHREHSPGYHHMILGSLLGARRSKLLDQELDTFLGEAESVLSWMISPDGSLATFGDSDYKPRVYSPPHPLEYQDRHIKYLWSGGKGGEKPDSGVKVIADAGYVFARVFDGEKPASGASYFAQMAGFHSRTHKHADHFSFVWHEGGRQVLVDPGRYAYAGKTAVGSDLFLQGFWYSDPRRVYVESTRAHNCLEIDGKSYPRHRTKPFGSALRLGGYQNGLVVTDCEVTHLRTVRHRRIIVMSPGKFMLVLDWLNDRLRKHDYRQWFQFAPEWIIAPSQDGMLGMAPERGGLSPQSLFMFNLIEENTLAAPIRGQESPNMQGWYSDAAYSLVPSASLAVEALSRSMGRFATLFVLDGEARLDRRATRFNTTLRAGSVRWSDSSGSHVLSLTLGEPGSVTANIESAA